LLTFNHLLVAALIAPMSSYRRSFVLKLSKVAGAEQLAAAFILLTVYCSLPAI
jgi:hypothetical protein